MIDVTGERKNLHKKEKKMCPTEEEGTGFKPDVEAPQNYYLYNDDALIKWWGAKSNRELDESKPGWMTENYFPYYNY